MSYWDELAITVRNFEELELQDLRARKSLESELGKSSGLDPETLDMLQDDPRDSEQDYLEAALKIREEMKC